MIRPTLLKKAFTLVEMLIVIVIIGILAAALIPKVIGIQERARYTRVEKDFRLFQDAVFLAQTDTNKKLLDITGSFCTMLPCRGAGNTTEACVVSRVAALRAVENAAGMGLGNLSSIEKDPWGHPYLLNENEGEGGCDNFDNIWTAGADGMMSTGIEEEFSTPTIKNGDDFGMSIRSIFCPGSY